MKNERLDLRLLFSAIPVYFRGLWMAVRLEKKTGRLLRERLVTERQVGYVARINSPEIFFDDADEQSIHGMSDSEATTGAIFVRNELLARCRKLLVNSGLSGRAANTVTAVLLRLSGIREFSLTDLDYNNGISLVVESHPNSKENNA